MKVTINPVGSIINATTAETNIDDNFEAIQTAIENTLSRDGTSPNQMEDTLDMNSNDIINLPTPGSNYSPVRVIDIASLATGGTINVSTLPVGGSTGQVLSKNSGTNYDAGWSTPHYLPAGGLTDQLLKKNSGTDYDVSWFSSSSLSSGGSTNSIQYNNGAGFGGISLTNGQVISGLTGITPVAAYPSMVNVVTGFGVDNTGATNVTSTLQTAINTITTADCIVYIPEGTYNLVSGSLGIPSYATIVCHPNAVIRRTLDPTYTDYTTAMVYWTGTQVKWYGGVLENTVVAATSATSNTVNGSNKTWTTQAGLPFIPGSTFLRVWSASHPEAHFEGTVSAYSGTTLTINSPFFGGSGTYTDWNIGIGYVDQCAMDLHGATKSLVEGVRIIGNWYVGLMMSAVNPPAGGPLNCQYNTIRNCFVEGIQNRGIYLNGNCNDNVITGCFVDGTNIFSGCTDYSYNFNGANATGSANAQLRNKVLGCRAANVGFQGFGIGDQVFYMVISDCTVSNVTEAAGNGFSVFIANGISPQYVRIHNCIATNCGGAGFAFFGTLYGEATGCAAVVNSNGFVIGPSAGVQSQYIHIGDCSALSNSNTGFSVQGNSARCDLSDVQAISNTSFGVNIGSGSAITVANGRAFGNGTNFADSGTGTVSSFTTA